jgi:hypothetical protein
VTDRDVDLDEKVAAIVAGAVMRRFNALRGSHSCSPIVFAAAADVLRIVFTADEPLRALDEFEALEANLREAR